MKIMTITVGALLITAASVSDAAFASDKALSAEELQLAVLAGGCAGCHGTDGQMSGLSARSEQQLRTRLMSFKNDAVPSTIMGRIAKGYSDAEIADIARYFANLDR